MSNATELFNVLVNPLRSDFALCWHRDDIKNSADEDEERAQLVVRHYGVCDAYQYEINYAPQSLAIGPVEHVSTLSA